MQKLPTIDLLRAVDEIDRIGNERWLQTLDERKLTSDHER